jgi:predicted nucleic acid-binding protein
VETSLGLLINTSFFYALHRKNDKNYIAAEKIFHSDIWKLKKPVLTSCLVVEETYTLAIFRTKNDLKLLKDLNLLFWGEGSIF